MREDMFQVILEGARRPPFSTSNNRKKQIERHAFQSTSFEMEERLQTREKIRPLGSKVNEKRLTKKFGPLWRFLSSQVGRSWDSIYSELRQKFVPLNKKELHVIQQLKMNVAEATFIGKDGRVYEYSGRSEPLCLEEPAEQRRFYIHPITRILRETPRKAKAKKSYRIVNQEFCLVQKQIKDRVKLTELSQYRIIDGMWQVVEFEIIPPEEGVRDARLFLDIGTTKQRYSKEYPFHTELNYSKVGDFLHPKGLSNSQRTAEYGYANIRAVSKRPLGKREMRHLKALLENKHDT